MNVTSTIARTSKESVHRLAWLYHPRTWKEKGIIWSTGLALATYIVIVVILGIVWSTEPDLFNVRQYAHEVVQEVGEIPATAEASEASQNTLPVGVVTTTTAIGVARALLEKPGGYLSNDIFPPGVYLDNIPNWEFGVLVQLRDFVRAMRNDFARAQTQSIEDKALQIADPQFSYNSESWILPSSESQYRKGIEALLDYLERLTDEEAGNADFLVRSDNLRLYLNIVEKRLGDMVQRLAAAVGQVQYNLKLAGERQGQAAKSQPREIVVKTPWWEIDDIFFEARGTAWALTQFLRALQTDFERLLHDKNAEINLAQIIRELENSQRTIWSPLILNGTGFGILANHSLVMASYLAKANAAVINLNGLLLQ